jgi:hypothetical protein
MTFRPSPALKPVATELAALLAARDPDRKRLERLMRLLAPPVTEKVTEPSLRQEEERIGIWKRAERNGAVYYARDPEMKSEWPFWADVQEIAPKGGKKRIVLIGESVARGFFYDPHYTAAEELAGILKKVEGFPAAEVIDLARAGLNLPGLLRLIRSCPALEPDVVVLFAGNNWRTERDENTHKMLPVLYEIYQRDSYAGARSLLEIMVRDAVMSVLKAVADVLLSRDIPVLFVIPEFNLSGWKSDELERVPLRLPGDGLSRWVEARKVAESARDAGDLAGAAAAAKELLGLDPSNPLGYEWLADCCIHQGRWLEARTLLESARDTALLGKDRTAKPRCYTVIQDTLRGEANRHGIGIIDLPLLFREKNTHLPDRELFLDYCHLTIKGIRMAMSAVAARLTGREVAAMPESGITLSNEVLGSVHFCAAIHHAHCGQPAEIVQYHCRQALSFSPNVRQLMSPFADFSSRTVSSVFCRSFEELIIGGELRQYEGGRGLAHPKNRKLMDVELVDAMTGVAGEGLERNVYALRMQEHGLTSTKKDLLEPCYSMTFYYGYLTRLTPLFLQCRAVSGFFYFVVEEGPVGFELVYRTPACIPGQGSIDIGINAADNIVARLPPAEKWATVGFTVDKQWLVPGVNRLFITWPVVSGKGEGCGRTFDHDFFNVLFPPLGEIFSLFATDLKS